MVVMLTKIRRRRYYIDKNNDNNALVATEDRQSTTKILHLIYKQTQQIISKAFVSVLSKQQPHAYAEFVIGINILVLLYYAIIAEPITTVAHGCAIILGLVLWRISLLT